MIARGSRLEAAASRAATSRAGGAVRGVHGRGAGDSFAVVGVQAA